MTITEALQAKLLSEASLTALVGSRIYGDGEIPQDNATWPVLTHRFQSGDETPYLSGEANDLHRDTFELTVHGDVRKTVDAVRDVLLERFAGITPRGLWQPGIFVSGCMPSLTSASADSPMDGSERRDREANVNLLVIWGRR